MQFLSALFILFLVSIAPARAMDTDDMFNNARDAYKTRNDFALSNYAQQMQAQGYILAPYADYWLILLRLNTADNQTVQAFLTKYADLPFADRLRGEWLKILAKRGDWQTFSAEYPNFQRDDAAVTCYALDYQAQNGDASALTKGLTIWRNAAEQPGNCASLFDRMQAAKVLTADELWARFRLAMQADKTPLASSIALRAPGIDAADIKLIDGVVKNPQKFIEKKSGSYKTRYGRELNLYALDKLARSQPTIALDMWQKLQANFEPEERSYFWGRFGLHAARRHDPGAYEWLGRAQKGTLDPEQMAWKARSALRVKNWSAVLETVADMSQSQQDESAWRYWKARALKEKKEIPAANIILVPLSREPSYYGVLAMEELGDVMTGLPISYKASEDEVKTVASMAGIQRAMELQKFDMRWEAKIEWQQATRDFDDRQKIAAAELAIRQGWYDLGINTADKTNFVHDYALRYPTPYLDKVRSSAKDQSLDEAWIYGLTRQESRFMHYAKSGVGASGLMQLMPATANWIAKRLGWSTYNNSMIHEMDTNIQMGTYYMRYVLDSMGDQTLMATAAYNAGPSRAKRWADEKPMEGAIYAETIPFSETRNYVQKVMGNAYFYAQRLGTKVQTLKQRLGVIAGTGGTLTVDEVEQ
ncbi:MAG: transglycosylase SLT domain-containing protein [Methylophilaceae bacterium]